MSKLNIYLKYMRTDDKLLDSKDSIDNLALEATGLRYVEKLEKKFGIAQHAKECYCNKAN